jgi:hypothetical protein
MAVTEPQGYVDALMGISLWLPHKMAVTEPRAVLTRK